MRTQEEEDLFSRDPMAPAAAPADDLDSWLSTKASGARPDLAEAPEQATTFATDPEVGSYDSWLASKADAGKRELGYQAPMDTTEPQPQQKQKQGGGVDWLELVGAGLEGLGPHGHAYSRAEWHPEESPDAQDRDPNSQRSQAMRAAFGDTLRGRGIDPSQLSAKDFDKQQVYQWLTPPKPTNPLDDEYKRAMIDEAKTRAKGPQPKPLTELDQAHVKLLQAQEEEARARAKKLSGGGGGGYGAPPAGDADARLQRAWGSAEIPPDVTERWHAIQRESSKTRARSEADFFGAIANDQRRNAPGSKADSRGQGNLLNVTDFEGSSWAVDDPESAQRIINKRAMTKDTLHSLADAKTALQSLDAVIANREKHGSNASNWNAGLGEKNRLYIETAKQNYAKAMGMPNTDKTQAELAHLFPDPNAVSGHGMGGTIKGLASLVGLADDPVLAELKAARAEAIHNLTSKIGIPSLRYVGGGHEGSAKPASAAQPAQSQGVIHGGYRWTKNPDGTYTKEPVSG